MSSSQQTNGKVSLILIAYHHGTDNIASQRFRGLLRHLPPDENCAHVISGPLHRSASDSDADVTFVDAPLLADASFYSRLAVLSQMLLPAKFRRLDFLGTTWVSAVVSAAQTRIRHEIKARNRVVVMATYSPVDALIAARLVAEAEGVPYVQDFRDGLAFENLGRSGALYKFMRQGLERWAVRSAAQITAVTRPLFSFFCDSYTHICVSVLYNGFDKSEYAIVPDGATEPGRVPCSHIAVGHFGRISASDAASFDTFHRFVRWLSGATFAASLHFFGTLTEDERELLKSLDMSSNLHGQVSRDKSVRAMTEMSALLVVTGARSSVATGKLFEYLFSGRRIVLATRCKNEASRLLKEIGDDDIVLDFSDPDTLPRASDLEDHLRRPFTRSWDKIARFDKAAQALELSAILEAAAATRVHT